MKHLSILIKQKKKDFKLQLIQCLDIKKTQLGYKSVYGKYADNFDELVKFVENKNLTLFLVEIPAVIDAAKNSCFWYYCWC
jgi:hypothetical protein